MFKTTTKSCNGNNQYIKAKIYFSFSIFAFYVILSIQELETEGILVMYEEIKNKQERLEKIEKLKEKILKEIERENKLLKKELFCLSNENNDSKEYDDLVTKSYQLIELKKYIQDENSFCSIQFRDCITGDTIYFVSIKNINIWLDESYNFVSNYLSKLENKEYILFELLDDQYFGKHFTHIFDEMRFDRKQLENKENN